MIREDYDLGFILQYENIAWYENGKVKILDRRIYPIKTEFVICYTHLEVAQAIKDMVTQSGGPYTAAGMGMALAAFESRDLQGEKRLDFLEKAAKTLAYARPTTARKMYRITQECLDLCKKNIDKQDLDQALFNLSLEKLNDKYIRIGKRADYLVNLFPKKGTIMTQCFAETIVGLILRKSREANKDIKLICPETRPYFQGSRLTASLAKDQGFDVTVISDNMVAYSLYKKQVDLFTSAADVISLDGHVVNKVGTFQIALACDYYNIPYFVTGNPDISHKDISTIDIEERDGNLVLEFMGTKLTKDGVKGYYPAFDITPPKLISEIITDKGVFSPYDLK